MATSDLANELAKESFKFEEYMANIEKQVTDVVLTQLEDQSGDISGLAVKWWVMAECLVPHGRVGGRAGGARRRGCTEQACVSPGCRGCRLGLLQRAFYQT